MHDLDFCEFTRTWFSSVGAVTLGELHWLHFFHPGLPHHEWQKGQVDGAGNWQNASDRRGACHCWRTHCRATLSL